MSRKPRTGLHYRDPGRPLLLGGRALPAPRPRWYARHDERLGGGSPLWRLMAPTTSQRQLLLREEGGKEARGELAAQRTETAYEARRSGRACQVRRSPMSIKRPLRRRGGRARKAVRLIRGDLHGRPRCPVHSVRGVVRDGGVREGAARRGEVSRGRITSRDRDDGWEGPNAKPSAKMFVLVIVAMTAANPARGLAGKVQR